MKTELLVSSVFLGLNFSIEGNVGEGVCDENYGFLYAVNFSILQ